MSLNICFLYDDEKKREDGYIDGTANVIVEWNGVEENFYVLFQTFEKLDEDKIRNTIAILEFHLKSLNGIIIYPVLFVQLILTSAGCRMVFHVKDGAVFQGVHFHVPMLLGTFKKMVVYEQDGMKPSRQFKHDPLKGLWYKHVTDASISGLAKNILNENGRNKWLVQKCEEKFGPFDSSTINEEELGIFIRNEMLVEGQKKRRERNAMTGEWIVFKKVDEKLHLLTLASHKEGDHRIYERISWSDSLD